MRTKLLLVAAAVFSASLVVHADTIQNFYASGTFSDGASLGGAITIDTTIGTVAASNLIIGSPDSSMQTVVQGQGDNFFGSGSGYGLEARNAAGTLDINLIFDGLDSLVNYKQGSINGDLTYLATITGPTLPNASFSATAPTPEPSSIVLIGTGMLGLLGVTRRCFGIQGQ